jgi:hypothetical protein
MEDRTFDLGALDEALRSAFPRRSELERMLLYKLDWRLDDFAGNGGLKEVVHQLLVHAESVGGMSALVQAAHRMNPGNPRLKSYYETHFSVPPSPAALEKIVRNELQFQDFAQWQKRQQEILRQVCRIEVDGEAIGTGFLVGKAAVLTNLHVITDADDAPVSPDRITCRFDYSSVTAPGQVCALGTKGVIASSPWSPEDLFPDPKDDPSEEHLDFALLHLAEAVGEARGHLPLSNKAYPFRPRTPLFIVQHPDGEPIRVAIDTQAVLKVNGNRTRVRYRTNTLGGSSGSPCFDSSWELVALHHSGDPAYHHKGEAFGRYNEGIPIDRIRARIEALGFLPFLS